jgi:hypothetical protein
MRPSKVVAKALRAGFVPSHPSIGAAAMEVLVPALDAAGLVGTTGRIPRRLGAGLPLLATIDPDLPEILSSLQREGRPSGSAGATDPTL